jgi:TrmH family RNA methyltransferase
MKGKLETVIRDLQLKRGRERRGLALAEGVRLVEEALAAGVPIRAAAVSPLLEGSARGAALKDALAHAAVPLTLVDDRQLAGLADTEHPQGLIAVNDPPPWSWSHL